MGLAVIIGVFFVFGVAPVIVVVVGIGSPSSGRRYSKPVVEAVRRQVARQQERPPRGLGKALTRRRWRRIARAGNRRVEPARLAIFRGVFDDWTGADAPDDERPELLRRWAGQEMFDNAVTVTATSPGDRCQARMADYCLRHGLLPRSPTRRACFYALTGQHEQRRAFDPDGSFLAAAYRSANQKNRPVLWDALPSDDLDAIRAMILSRRQLWDLTALERGYLARHGLAPDGPVERACFLALTRQHDQRRALDPDGSLLAAGYQAASEQARAELRQGLLTDGDLDVVRVVAGGEHGIGRITAGERGFVVTRLADRRDWAGLWRLARELPVHDAVEALRRADRRWRPDSQRDRELFALLSAAGANRVQASRDALRERAAIRIEAPGMVRAGALSADGTRLALWIQETDPAAPGTISVFSLPRGDLLASHAAAIGEHAVLAYSGDALAAFTARYERSAVESWLYFCPREDGQPVRPDVHYALGQRDAVIAMAARPGGFVTVDLDTTLRLHTLTGEESGTVRYGSPLHELSYASDVIPRFYDFEQPQARIAVDHETGRIAVFRDLWVTVVEPPGPPAEPEATHRKMTFGLHGVCLRGGLGVVASSHGNVRQWYFSPQRGYGGTENRTKHAREIAWVRARDEICYRDSGGTVGYLDGTSLQPAATGGELAGRTGLALFSSADCSGHALGGAGFADVATPECIALRTLAERPQSAWTPSDLAMARGVSWLAERNPQARPFYELLLACLEQRFGSDVAIGQGVPEVGDDDVRISREGTA